MQDKQWTERESAGAAIRKIPYIKGRARHFPATLASFGRYTLPSDTYSYQAAVADTSTGVTHLLGRMRGSPGTWTWAGIHPASMERWIQLRGEEAAAMEGERVPPH